MKTPETLGSSPIVWKPVEACHLKTGEIAHLAEHISSQCGYQPTENLRELVAEKFGGMVQTANLSDLDKAEDKNFFGDDIRIKKFRDFEIRVSPFSGELRERFSIAHELGHYVLHFLYPTQRLQKNLVNVRAFRAGGTQPEKEANWFAASFLMPKNKFTALFEQHGYISVVASELRVSQRAAFYRAKALGLIPE